LNRSDSNVPWYAVDLAFKNGVHGRIDVVPTTGMLEETYELFGEDFRAIVTAPFGQDRGLRCYRGNRLVLDERSDGTPEDVLSGFYDETAAFIGALSRNEHLSPAIADVYPSVELCHDLAGIANEEP